MNNNDFIINPINICIIGLGYVGLPLAIAFSKKISVLGYDINNDKISELKTNYAGDKNKATNITFTNNESDLLYCNFFIVAVPTPIDKNMNPDLSSIYKACNTLGKYLTKNSIVVFESTVYPGTTEEICIPILEKASGLKCGVDFKVGYSPERINPGDTKHEITNITKIISGIDEETVVCMENTYSLILDPNLLYKAENIKTAEAAKIIENCQRDINIAFVNEMSIILSKLNIDSKSVFEAAKTKWNFIPFNPGLVGGHCIGVDPYYIIYKAKEVGHESVLLSCCRNINESMSNIIVENVIKIMILNNINVYNSNILILGYAYKENCSDIRNTKIENIALELESYGINIEVIDPLVNKNEAINLYNRDIINIEEAKKSDVIILAVPHDVFKEQQISFFNNLYKSNSLPKIFIDIYGTIDKKLFANQKYIYWGL